MSMSSWPCYWRRRVAFGLNRLWTGGKGRGAGAEYLVQLVVAALGQEY